MLADDEQLLDNPVYAALCTAHERFAHVSGRARRYPAEITPFFGIPSDPTAEDWRDATELFPAGTIAAVLQGPAEAPPGWTAVRSFEVAQMVEQRVTGAACEEAVPLGAADVPEMLELVAMTEPGPFLARTIELGDYLGIRRGRTLVAMAGERLHLEGWTEISAVCTLPSHRGHGLASALMGALIAAIHGRSERAFLHVLSTNDGAIGLYERLGFRIRRTATITVVMAGTPNGA